MVNWIGLERAASRLSVSTYVEFHQATNYTFDPYMPFVVVGALLGGIVLAVLSQGIHLLSGELAIAGIVCYVAVLAVALSTNVRIYKQIARWPVESPPGDWARIRARWVRFHTVRTLFFTSRTGLLHCCLSCESITVLAMAQYCAPSCSGRSAWLLLFQNLAKPG
jgi:hypothetical protein